MSLGFGSTSLRSDMSAAKPVCDRVLRSLPKNVMPLGVIVARKSNEALMRIPYRHARNAYRVAYLGFYDFAVRGYAFTGPLTLVVFFGTAQERLRLEIGICPGRRPSVFVNERTDYFLTGRAITSENDENYVQRLSADGFSILPFSRSASFLGTLSRTRLVAFIPLFRKTRVRIRAAYADRSGNAHSRHRNCIPPCTRAHELKTNE